MDISNNSLCAFMANKSSLKEDRDIFHEMENNELFSDLVDLIHEFDAIEELNELRNEFNESIDKFNEVDKFKDIKF